MVSQRIIKQRESLPIFQFRKDIIDAIKNQNLLIIIGETGSGKTTQIPQYILESFEDCRLIGVTQPRRIAAITVANRVSEEHGTRLGDEVGYCIRFDDCTSSRTRLKYMTDGVLLREATLDPRLEHYEIIIIDEAHERTLETDVLFGLLKETHRLRPELKILIMSATLNVEKFSDFFNECPIFVIPGRTYDVAINHHRDAKISSLKSTYVQRAVDTALYIHTQEPPGDILVFLTGQSEIERACLDLDDQARELNYRKDVKYYNEVKDLVIYPIHATLETMEQKAIFEDPPKGTRKVVFATNIAQTSVTIPGIKYVVDTGFVKQKSYDPSTGMDALLVVPISQAAATQRAGRAGRTAPGKAFRLYSRESFEQMEIETVPEIQRSSLLGTVLSLKKMGIRDIIHFEFIDPPDPILVKNALKQLFLLEALDENGNLTPLGDEMCIFPLNPFLSRVLIASARQFECSREVSTIVAILSVEEIFITPRNGEKLFEAYERRKEFYHHLGDYVTLLYIFEGYRDSGYDRDWCRDKYFNYRALSMAKNVRDQLRELMEKHGIPIISCGQRDDEDVHRKKRSKKSYYEKKAKKYDFAKILEAFSSSYYIHLAKRHPHRAVFYHYASANVYTSEMVDSNSSLLALHISPMSALHPDNKIVKIDNLDWVMYHSVLYTSKALMKVVSKVKLEWVEEKLKLFKKLETVNLDGDDKRKEKEVKSDSNKNTVVEPNKLEQENDVIEDEEEKKRKKLEAIEAARQRALSRRSLNADEIL
ncbi:P-loop containing nucleoside triphosphate hydrolase protein [Glomus cerebriforme]|uniref:RNA helicase n=1 Tax=Glomus cerebriforme TaxID=658196 RepID=A0A397TCP7_9GLOM|nr:P-loop containing nucleoside triphosphate hydrolase protein [Glomus cerebriforme]